MIEFADVKKAKERIEPYIFRTPLLRVPALDDVLNCQVYIKPENLQFTGSFKYRGAMNKVQSLTDEEKSAGVVAASSGNHGQGVAYAAKIAGIDATIVMPTDVNPVKLKNCQDYGAKTLFEGTKSSEREVKMNEIVANEGKTSIHPYGDDFVKAGQGTMALEILEDEPDMDFLVVPIGGGGMISGISVGAKGLSEKIKIIGVEPTGARRYTESLKIGEPAALDKVDTIADGTRTDKANPGNFEIIKNYVDEIVTVDDDEIKDAMKAIVSGAKIIAEPSSSMPVAAAMYNKIKFNKDDKVCFVISGGNNDLEFLSEIIA